MDFFCKLVAPRPAFGQDMTAAEGELMQRHAVYWNGLMARGHVVTFGVAGDPKGVFGIAVVTFGSEAEVRTATDADPVIQADAGFSFEIIPCRSARHGPDPRPGRILDATDAARRACPA